jgi:hypothetical protein
MQQAGFEVGHHDEVTNDKIRRAAVLMNAVPDVHPGRADIARPAVLRPADEHLPAVLLWAALQPHQRATVTVEARLAEPDAAGDEEFDRER